MIIRIFKVVFRVLGILLLGGIALIIAMLQPIDGIPGYKLITQEDYSIIFGFALTFGFGGVVGYFVGGLFGESIGVRVSDAIHKSRNKINIDVESIYAEEVYKITETYINRRVPIEKEALTTTAIENTVNRLMTDYKLSKNESIILLEKMGQKGRDKK